MIPKPTRMQRAYIEAVGCRPIAFVRTEGIVRASSAAYPWDREKSVLSAFWFADARTVSYLMPKIVAELRDAPTAAVFDHVIGKHASNNAAHKIPHKNLISMADQTAAEIEASYLAKKGLGEFSQFFDRRRVARQAATLTGDKVASAADDEFNLKAAMMRAAINKGK